MLTHAPLCLFLYYPGVEVSLAGWYTLSFKATPQRPMTSGAMDIFVIVVL